MAKLSKQSCEWFTEVDKKGKQHVYRNGIEVEMARVWETSPDGSKTLHAGPIDVGSEWITFSMTKESAELELAKLRADGKSGYIEWPSGY